MDRQAGRVKGGRGYLSINMVFHSSPIPSITYLHDLHLKHHGMCNLAQSCSRLGAAFYCIGLESSSNHLTKGLPEIPSANLLFLLSVGSVTKVRLQVRIACLGQVYSSEAIAFHLLPRPAWKTRGLFYRHSLVYHDRWT